MNHERVVGRVMVYRGVSLGLAIVFALVGVLFLTMPGAVLRFFNQYSASFGLEPTPAEGMSFYNLLAVGYMYIVSLIAWLMSRHPESRYFPVLLINAKFASSALSFGFFVVISHAAIYLANGIVDGCIAGVVFLLYSRLKVPA